MVFGRDITQKNKLHLREKARAQVLEMLAKGKPFHSILKQIVLSAQIYEPGLIGSIMLVDIERRKFTRGAAPSLPEYFIEAVESVYIQEGAGSCGTAAYLGKRIIVEDVATHPYFEGYGPLCEQVGIKSSWSEPILDPSGKVIGTFAFYRNKIASPSQEDLNYIKELNDICSIVFNKCYLILRSYAS
jgi:GAF domain-containing protein